MLFFPYYVVIIIIINMYMWYMYIMYRSQEGQALFLVMWNVGRLKYVSNV